MITTLPNRYAGYRQPLQSMLPNVIIIGAQKCATTSMHYYLNLHPQAVMSHPKELNYFINEHNFSKGLEWYQSHFLKPAIILGEASPLYTNYPEYRGVANKMYSLLPKAKLLYMVRDPIRRIYSNYVHNYADHLENQTFRDVLAKFRSNPYIDRSRYFMQLEQFRMYYPPQNILVVAVEDLMCRPRVVMKKIFRFLNIDHTFYSRRFNILLHRLKFKRRKTTLGQHLMNLKAAKLLMLLPVELQGLLEKLIFFPFSTKIPFPQVPPETIEALKEYLTDDTNQLRKFTGEAFKHWSL